MNAQRINAQLRCLQKAQAVVACATWAARHGVEADYDDVMEVVAALIDQVIAALDSTEMM
jgi:hypothetical protein